MSVTMLFALDSVAQTTVCSPMLPWEQDFVTIWGLNDDIAWMAEDISEFDLNYNDGFRAGIWGLTASSARFYGLKVNSAIDERFNVRKSTEAVVKYMHNLIAFHHGDTLAAMTMYINTSLVDEGDSAFRRPDCAVKYISREKLAALDSAYNVPQKRVIVRRPVQVCTVAETTDTANVGKIEPVAVAVDTAATVTEKITPTVAKPEETKQAQKEEEERAIIYRVKSGDNLSRIAQKYNVRVKDIMIWNGLKNDVIHPDQTLFIKIKK